MAPRFLCAGEILWDALPEGLFLGGAPFNVACHLRQLGQNVEVVTRIGCDQLGDQILRRVTEKQIATDQLQRDAQHGTGLVDAVLDAGGNASYTFLDPAAWDFIAITDKLRDLAASCTHLVFGSLAQRRTQSRETIRQLQDILPKTVFDVNLRPPYLDKAAVEASLHEAWLVKLNDDEVGVLAGWFGLPSDLREFAFALSAKYACESVCITRGAQGAAILLQSTWTEVAGISVGVADTVGAGDAFLAALLSRLVSEAEAGESLAYANAVGAYVASQRGATPALNREKIKQLMITNKV